MAIVSAAMERLDVLVKKLRKEEIGLPRDVQRKVVNMSNTLRRIQPLLPDADLRKISDKAVDAWLNNLIGVSYDIDDVLNTWNIEGTSNKNASPSIKQRVCSIIPLFSYFKQGDVPRDVAAKLEKMSKRLEEIDKEKDQLGFITGVASLMNNTSGAASTSKDGGVASSSQERKRVQSTSFKDLSEVIGREKEKYTLVLRLLSGCNPETDPVQILSIIGVGGMGKTTLAQLAFNDDRVKGHFDLRVWVCVSSRFDGIRIFNAILESLGLRSDMLELDSLLRRIKDRIVGKRFLLVLDDVWFPEASIWEHFQNFLGYGAPGATVLLTSRSERVARAAGTTGIIHLVPLSESDAWSLFRHLAFLGRTATDCQTLEDIGKNIVRKCQGLPLAIKCIGCLLRFKDTAREWSNILHGKIWPSGTDEAESFLSLSYNDLPFQLKRCISYCAVFPEYERIEVDDLIRIWMAQGYLNSSGGEEEMELKGQEYFENLGMLYFFHDYEYDELGERIVFCKMHDIVHQYMQFLTKWECETIDGERIERYFSARHITWLAREEVPDQTLSFVNLGQPRSFLGRYLKLRTLEPYLLDRLKLVRVLKLEECDLKEVPRGIEKLIHLRYLDLSYNYELRELPKTIYNLFNLQTIKLQGCQSLRELPPGIEKLTKLRHLISDVYRMKYPLGIQELVCLQTLSVLSVGREFNKFGELKNLNQLQRSLIIHVTDELDDVADVKNGDLKSKKYIQTLELSFSAAEMVKEDVMDALEPPPNLQMLDVCDYGGNRLPTWITSLDNLRQLSVINCFELAALPALGMLPSLEKLQILKMPRLVFVGSAFLGIKESFSSPAVVFPKLKELKFAYCEEWEVWEEEDHTVLIMPCLQQLTINWCPKLKALPYGLLRKVSSLNCIVLDKKEYDTSILFTTHSIAEIKAG